MSNLEILGGPCVIKTSVGRDSWPICRPIVGRHTGLSLRAGSQRNSQAEKEVIAVWIWLSITREKGNELLLVDAGTIVQ